MKGLNENKGISPLIASVLIIAMAIAVSGIVSGFLLDFTEERTDETRERMEEDIDCMYANLRLESYEEDGNITMEIVNNGDIALSDFKLRVHRDIDVDEMNTTDSDILLEEGRRNFFEFDVDGEFESVEFFSEWCPSRTSVEIEEREL